MGDQPLLRLSIELVPTPCWGNNLRTTLTAKGWARISKEVRAAGRCEICGATDSRLSTDERWSYDDKRHIQQLTGLRAVCQNCHSLIHIGRTSIVARAMADRYPTLMEEVIAHFMRVNGVGREGAGLGSPRCRISPNGFSMGHKRQYRRSVIPHLCYPAVAASIPPWRPTGRPAERRQPGPLGA